MPIELERALGDLGSDFLHVSGEALEMVIEDGIVDTLQVLLGGEDEVVCGEEGQQAGIDHRGH